MGAQRRLIGALLALAAALCAAGTAAADPAAWRISGERGGEVTLLGSMHVLRAARLSAAGHSSTTFTRAPTFCHGARSRRD